MYADRCLILTWIIVYIHAQQTTTDYNNGTIPFELHPCNGHFIVESSYNRTVNYTLQTGDEARCDTSNITSGWYRFVYFQNILSTPPLPGQCGSMSPIWLNGSYPTVYGETSLLTACVVSNRSQCEHSWNVTVMSCQYYNIAYLEPEGYCGRYCMAGPYYRWMDSTLTPYYDSCFTHTVVDSNVTRSLNFTLPPGDNGTCESNMTSGWYRFSGYQNIPTHAPQPGQCGSTSPIYLQGVYPMTYGESRTMTACMVGNGTGCKESWYVNVKNCGSYNVIFLEPSIRCGRYCMDDSSLPYTTPSSWYDPCYSHNIVDSDYTRSINYTLQYGDSGTCESNNITAGWYRFSGYQNIPTQVPQPGQCGSTSPIYLQGEYPTMYGDSRTMTACMVGNYYTGCTESWSITVKYCGGYNVAYLTPSSMCGKYCMDSSEAYVTSTSGYDECLYPGYLMNDYTREIHFTMQWWQSESCESTYLQGWYRYDNLNAIPTQPPQPGQCGTSFPIYLQGSYPMFRGEYKQMAACIVGNDTQCIESWNVTTKNCGEYYIFYLIPSQKCGKYCMGQEGNCNNYKILYSNPTRLINYTKQFWEFESCESKYLRGWYRYEGGQNIPTQRPRPGQCGTSFPIYLQGLYPSVLGQQSVMTACVVRDDTDCADSLSVTAMNCGEYNIVNLQTSPECGTYCMDDSPFQYSSSWYDACLYHNIIDSDYTRSIHYTLQYGDSGTCESNNISAGWYRFSGYQNISTQVPQPGQCGSTSPIYLQGEYPTTYGETRTMKASLVAVMGYYIGPVESWLVTIKYCGGYNIAYLEPSYSCGRYCMNDSSLPYTTPSSWYDACYYHNIVDSDYTRSFNYTLQYDDDGKCESNNITAGWYRFSGNQNIPTQVPQPGQCGSKSPIYLQGEYPTMYGDSRTMTACMVGNYYTGCTESWSITVKYCGGYNVAYLTPSSMCGRYCMDSSEAYVTSTSGYDECLYPGYLMNDYTREIHFTMQWWQSESCESTYLQGWYRYDNLNAIPTQPPQPGQCGTSFPIYLQGSYPMFRGEYKQMAACIVGNDTQCIESWNVTTKNCGEYYIFYLIPSQKCGKYCMGQEGNCNNYKILYSNPTRLINYTKQFWEFESCESKYLRGWYRYEGGQNIPTQRPRPGQCGTSFPIYLQGLYPSVLGQQSVMTACVVRDDTDCADSLSVTAMNCGEYNIVNLRTSPECGTYCMDDSPFQYSSSWYDACLYHNIIDSDYTRSIHYTLQYGDSGTCESNNISAGWYRFSGYQNISTQVPQPGQCGSTSPIYLQGEYPTTYGETRTMKASLVAVMGYYIGPVESWLVTIKYCGGYNIAYLEPSYSCGRYCMNDSSLPYTTPSSWYDACYYHNIVDSDYTRSFNYTLQYDDDGKCESNNITAGWYRFSGNQNIPTQVPQPGQCGSKSPIYLQGEYPTMYGDSRTMTACMVGNYYTGCTESWSITVKYCGGYNVAYLTPSSMCGRYCMDSSEAYVTSTSGYDECLYPGYLMNDYTREIHFTMQWWQSESCESTYLQGWYRYDDLNAIPTQPPQPGQCGTSFPIYLQGSYPMFRGEYKQMAACIVGNDTQCIESWNVTTKNCGEYYIFYLIPSQKCGKYCMGQEGNCNNYKILYSNPTRLINYTKQFWEFESCESKYLRGWYRYEGGQNIPTQRPRPGQCGTSFPIYLQGLYPSVLGQQSVMTACVVRDDTDCADSLSVTAMNCGEYNIVNLQTSPECGTYCMDDSPFQYSSSWYDACLYHNIIDSDYTRSIHYTLQYGDSGTCESNNISAGWYRFSGYQNISTQVPQPGQCGSTSPIYLQGEYPTTYGETRTMKASLVAVMGYYIGPVESWLVTIKYCGGYNIAYLEPSYSCGRYCMNDSSLPYTTPSSWYDACYYHNIVDSDYTRSFNYTLQYDDDGKCESNNITAGWYRFSGNQNIPTQVPQPGQCGSKSPIYLQGEYPTMYGDSRTMTACMVGNYYTGCTESWSITVKYCGGYNVAYLTPSSMCGRYCMDSSEAYVSSTSGYDECLYPGYLMNDYTREIHFTMQWWQSESCESTYLQGWYRYDDLNAIPTQPPQPGQCGTSFPIYLQGSYPMFRGEYKQMAACIVGNDTQCIESWNVTTKNCGEYYIFYLIPSQKCGKYCMGQEGNCNNYKILYSNPTRLINYTKQFWEFESCESKYLRGWYRYEGGQNIPTQRPRPGQCGTSFPIYLQGLYPSVLGQQSVMTACVVRDDTDCADSLSVTAMNCGEYNIVNLQISPECGTYCMDSQVTTPSTAWLDECNSSNYLMMNPNRDISYRKQYWDYESCESTYLSGWYRYYGDQNIATKAPSSGQCGSSYPIYLQGSYPAIFGQYQQMYACIVGNDAECIERWPVTAKNCGPYNVVYLTPSQRCGAYCIDSSNVYSTSSPGYDECSNAGYLMTDYTREISYIRQDWQIDSCESTYLNGWYRYSGFNIIVTQPPQPGQCGTSFPIYLQGSYPVFYGEYKQMTACIVGNDTQCIESWTVTTKNCGEYYIFYLIQSQKCGKYCMGSNSSDMTTTSAWYGYCYTYNVLYSNPSRLINYTKQFWGVDYCESNYLIGWYRYDGGQNIPTQPPVTGQCGSSSPIYLQGFYPTVFGEQSVMTACMVGNDTDCKESWSVKAMNCGGYNIVYLQPSTSCGTYCMDDSSFQYTTTSSWYEPCYNNYIVDSDYTRSINYTLQYGDSGTCESNNLTAGWYRFSGYQNITTQTPRPGQCGSSSPIYLQGEYPTMYGETRLMTACMVGNYYFGCMESWLVNVKNCGGYNIAYLEPSSRCGRYCMDSSNVYSTSSPGYDECSNAGYLMTDYTREISYIRQDWQIDSCESTYLNGWYRYSGFNIIVTQPPQPGQCGTSFPIYLQGSYPVFYGEYKQMTACIVGNDTQCIESWTVTTKNCGEYYIFYLIQSQKCGKYCMGSNSSDMTTTSAWYGYCYTYNVLYSNPSRLINYTKQFWGVDYCESNYLIGWYRYDGGQNIPTQPPVTGQCGSSSPIYLQGFYPTVFGEQSVMTACMVGNDTDCKESWSVKAMNCGGYNIVYLQPSTSCGTYCMDDSSFQYTTTSSWYEPCYNNYILDSDYTRSINYTLQYGDSGTCESNNLTAGWYRFSGYQNITTQTPRPGQCGSSSPIYLQGEYPTMYGETRLMTACMVGNYYFGCMESWLVNVKNCGGYNIAYLEPSSRCGRYCMDSSNVYSTSSPGYDECSNAGYLMTDYTREISYIRQDWQIDSCESTYLNGWYRYSGFNIIVTQPPQPGQCGTSFPIYLQGSYPVFYGEYKQMTACIVGNDTQCIESWTVTTKNCGEYYIFYLIQSQKCGKYCMGSNSSDMTTTSAWYGYCYTYNVLYSNSSRLINYTKQFWEVDYCESNYLIGWYRYDGGQNIPTQPPVTGQCGSSSPIYLQGFYPTVFGEQSVMTACMVGNDTDCKESWSVKAMNCGGYNIVYLQPSTSCGTYCMDDSSFQYTTTSSWYEPCYNNYILDSDYTRSINYTLQYGDSGTCESNNITAGWYRFSGYQNITTQTPRPGQCGSSSPIYLQGEYPTMYGETRLMTACMVGNYYFGCMDSWLVNVKNCGGYNIAYLEPSSRCGRYCMDSSNVYSTSSPGYDECSNAGYLMTDYTREISYIRQDWQIDSCESTYLNGWYRYSGFNIIVTQPPQPGQCGTSFPIYLQGSYPVFYGEYKQMTACIVGNDTQCIESWTVTTKNCGEYYIFYLIQSQKCGKYCMGSNSSDMTTTSAWYGYCYTYNVLYSNPSRLINYTKQFWGVDYCESNYLIGWYRYDGGQNIPTQPPVSGQCGSSSPIYLQGFYPTVFGEQSVMTACMVGNDTDCKESWSVKAMNCGGYNIVYLQPSTSCGTYCMDDSSFQYTTTSSWYEPCYNNYIVDSDYTRSINYTLQYGDSGTCESNNLTAGWYRFSGYQNITTQTPRPGQCGSSSPIYLQGEYPTMYGETRLMTACMVENYYFGCNESWLVNVKNCGGYNIAYLEPSSRCGRYCMDSSNVYSTSSPGYDECSNAGYLMTDYTREISYIRQDWQIDSCESTYLNGWYRYSGFNIIVTQPPQPGQCGTSFPIYLQGSYPVFYGEYKQMTACIVGNDTQCIESWTVTTKNCGEYYIFYLIQSQKCGKYCMGSNSSDMTTTSAWYGYCYTYNVLYSNPSRLINYTKQFWGVDYCESNYLIGWYRYDGGQNIPTQPPVSGQCGSSSPIYLQGFYPTVFGEQSVMTACMVGNDTDCKESWSVKAMNCGGYNIVYLQPSTSCGTYCMDDSSFQYTTTSSWYEPCYNNYIVDSDYTRSINYTLQYGDSGTCESNNLTAGWYRFSGYQNITTQTPRPGQCGSSSPIYLQGEYPTMYGETRLMTACMVENYYFGCNESWLVNVKNCGGYNIAYLEPSSRCGRYCMDSSNVYSTSSPGYDECSNAGYLMTDYTREISYIRQDWQIDSCESTYLNGWYRYSGFNIIVTQPPQPGQCGTSFPIYLQGSYPVFYGEYKQMTACIVGNDTQCIESWTVTTKNCGEYYIFYLIQSQKCGKYCMGSNSSDMTTTSAWYGYCYTYNVLYSNPSRLINYTKQFWEVDYCESNYLIGWYRYDGGQNIPTQPPVTGQCGSSSPIYLQGFYPTVFGEQSVMTACMVGNDTDCKESWSVKAMNCGGYNIVYLQPSTSCGTYCMDDSSFQYTTTSSWYEPCYINYIVDSDYTRSINYTLQYGDSGTCESNNITAGWYRFSGYQNITTQTPRPGQCGSSSPIYLQGEYPTMYGETRLMTACMVGNYYSECIESWRVNVKNCGGYNIAYLEPSSRCGRYCMESDYLSWPTLPPWVNPCINHTVIESNFTRTTQYFKQYGDTEACESFNIAAGWYRYENFENIPTEAPAVGQCGSMSPIWLKGTYPPSFGNDTMTACVVDSESDCAQSWNVTVMNCYSFNVVYLQPVPTCGRYCMSVSLHGYSTTDAMLSSSQDYFTIMPTASSDVYLTDESEYSSTSASIDSSQSDTESLYVSTSTSVEESNSIDLTYSTNQETPSSLSTTPSSSTTESDYLSWPTLPPWVNPCINHTVIESNFTRTTQYFKQYGDTETCESFNIAAGWYRYENFENIPTEAPAVGQCGSMSPIWLKGTYPHSFDNDTMTACVVDSESDCAQSWNVTVMNCYSFNVVYLQPVPTCGRYCMSVSLHGYSTTDAMLSSSQDYFTIMPTASSDVYLTADSQYSLTSASIDSSQSATESLYESTSTSVEESNSIDSTYSTIQETPSSLSTTPSSSTTDNRLDLSTYIYYIYANPVIPSYLPTSADRQLMFQCIYYYYWYGYEYEYNSILNNYVFDVTWEVDGEEFSVKSNLTLSQIPTLGRLKGTDLSDGGITMGFNINCGIRFSPHQHLGSNSYVKSSWSYYVGLDIWPRTLSISSGESASIYMWSTVPVACKYDSSYPCKLVIEMIDFNEQFTSGAPKYCNESITELTKPSLCGLELDGWRTPWTWQTLNINLPENTAQDQEYTAKLHLKVSSAVDDPLWLNYQLPEIRIHVVNDNVTDDYWWWYGWCFTGTDPWFFTFDWRWYDFHDEGEFVLYRHKTKPIEVHTIQRRYEPEHTWTEHCAIAIRAASDVFIIYGCGRPTKWVVRREGCDTGNEYLEVYSRWGGYEVTLPTGTRIYVYISVNRRLNAYITLSRTDRYETEGLCGTWNRNYDDDYTGRDGHVYDDATLFARTWSVPSSDSLFIAKKRTEKLSQSFMYCTCLGETLDKLSPNVDCSWKESLPVCPPLNWGKESCTIRTKRSTDSEEDLTIDVSPDIVSYTQRPIVSSDWKNGWNQSSAEDACNIYFNQSVLFAACSSLSNVNGSSAITNCILNIKVAGTDEYMADSFEMFKTQCSNEVRTNNTLWTETSANGTLVAEMITQNDCPYDCKYKGVKKGDCVQGYCNCHAGYTGDDCRVDMNSPPTIATDLSNDSFCDASTKACIYASVFGENFFKSSNLGCLIEKAEIVNNTLVRNGTSVTTSGNLVNLGEVKCPLIAGERRRRRSVATSTSTDYYLVSVTNNGVNYSDPLPVIHFDSSCTTCTTSSSYVFCQLRSDVCVINGICYAQSSSKCAASTSSSDSNLWIIGVVGCVLLFVIILILLIKWCKTPRPVSPFCGGDDGPLYDKPLSRAGTPHSVTRINVRSVE